MAYTSSFSFFGSKSKVAHLYPEPRYDTIVEPFCGSAAYSLRYADRRVLLFDIDIRVLAAWEFLTSGDEAIRWIRKIPLSVDRGDSIYDIIGGPIPPGLAIILFAEASRGTMGTDRTHKIVEKFGEIRWPSVRPRLLDIVERVRHWRVMWCHYANLPNGEATWYIDPPYSESGKHYRYHKIDYEALAQWCKSRKGQVIVCEQAGADWLPFEFLTKKRGMWSGGKHSHEALWTKG